MRAATTATTATLTSDRLCASIVPNRGANGGYSLVIDGVTQSHVNLDDSTDLQLDYVRAIAALIDVVHPGSGPISVLHLGGGALSVPRYVASRRPRSPQRVVELFGELLDFVLRTLPLPSGIDVELVVGDARAAVLEHAGSDVGRWDLVILDVFSGSVVPRHVSTVEFYSMLEKSLNADGVLLINTLTSQGLSFMHDAVATLPCLFPHVVAVAAPSVMSGARVGNIVLAASRRPLDLRGLEDGAALRPGEARVYGEPELLTCAVGGSVQRDALADTAIVDTSP